MTTRSNADAWGLPGVLDYFKTERTTTEQVYDSEWHFLKDKIAEGITVLDIGCAQGGFASVLNEHLKSYSYTGLDINPEMIAIGRHNHPTAEFLLMKEGDFSVLKDRTFDLVLVLGMLHLHETWRDTLAAAWGHTQGSLIFDLREIDGPSIEDKSRSYFRMNYDGKEPAHEEMTLPYNLINTDEARETISRLAPDARRKDNYGYVHAVSGLARCPVEDAMFNTWCLER